MGMLTYKEWSLLQESLGGAVPVGINTPKSIGTVGTTGVSGFDLDKEFEEAKAFYLERMKKKKKMACGDEDLDSDVEDSDDDDEEVSADSDSDLDSDSTGPSDKDSADVTADDEEETPSIMMKKKSKKKSKKCMKKEWDEMPEADRAFMSSLSSQLNSGRSVQPKHWDGVAEDYLHKPIDPNSSFYNDLNPEAGEVGFAPDGRITSFAENVSEGTFKKIVVELYQDESVPESVKAKIKSKLA